MEIKVFNSKLEFLDIVENFIQLTWTDKLKECGVFSLQASMTEKNINLLQKKNIIYIVTIP